MINVIKADLSKDVGNRCLDNLEHHIDFDVANISEHDLHQFLPEILALLLRDRTRSAYSKKRQNIIWANNNYLAHGKKYEATYQITSDLITGKKGSLIVPRALKSKAQQKERTKTKAEVFTPSWVVEKQNNALNENFINDDLETYVSRTWLEITCGEAPYMVNRYEMATGEIIPINDRVGFVDKKLKRINHEIQHQAKWQTLVEKAYQSSYGFEWNGDSLLLARENLLLTYRDYYIEKWQVEPTYLYFKKIAEIISYNVFQMDGLKCILPLSDTDSMSMSKINQYYGQQMDLFDEQLCQKTNLPKIQGKRVKIMDWKQRKMVFFDEDLSK